MRPEGGAVGGGDRERGQDGPESGYFVAGRFLGASDAALAASALEAAGIEARLRDQHTIGVNWFWSLALGGVAVEVPESRRAEAMELLEAADLQVERLSGAEERAYSRGLERRRRRGWWAIVLFTPWLWPLLWLAGTWEQRDREGGED